MTSETITAETQVVCPHCGTYGDPYPPSCGACGGDFAGGARRDGAQHAIPARDASLWSATEEAECAGDVALVLSRARQTIVQHGGTAGPPARNRLDGAIRHRSGYNLWIPVRYDITVSAVPAGDRRTSVRVKATLDAGGSVGNILTIVTVLLFILFTAGLYCALIALVSIPAQKQVAAKVARLILRTASDATGAAPASASHPLSDAGPIPAHRAGGKPVGTTDAFADTRRLAELRDLGAMSGEDFEAEKAELLGKI